nr:MAG TPA: hypothetical protein [Caudoviricetes sp.]
MNPAPSLGGAGFIVSKRKGQGWHASHHRPLTQQSEPRPIARWGGVHRIEKEGARMACLVLMFTICLLVIVWTNFND